MTHRTGRYCGKRALAAVLAITALAAGAAPCAGAAPAACSGQACGGTLVLIGTHGSGPGQGIFAARLDEATGTLDPLGLAAELERPTWLVSDPSVPRIYAVSETGNDGASQGGVYSLDVDRETGRLTVKSRTASGGGGATHLAYDSRSATIFVANFGGGQVTVIPVGSDGTLAPVVASAQNTGSGPNPRQKGPHAHGVTVDPSGRYVLSPDLGADKVFVYRWNSAEHRLTPAAIPALALPPGSGPRHLVFSPDGRFAFFDTELTGEVYAARWTAASGTLRVVKHVPLDPPDFAGARSAAELTTSADGRFLYVSNRGENLLEVLSVDPKTGSLTEIQRIDCGGKVPWSFAIDPTGRWMVVANETSSNVAVFAVNGATGRLTATPVTLAVPKPVAIAFVR